MYDEPEVIARSAQELVGDLNPQQAEAVQCRVSGAADRSRCRLRQNPRADPPHRLDLEPVRRDGRARF